MNVRGMWVGGVWVCTRDRNDLKLGAVVVLDILSQPINLGFKRSRVSDSQFMNKRSYAPFTLLWICPHMYEDDLETYTLVFGDL